MFANHQDLKLQVKSKHFNRLQVIIFTSDIRISDLVFHVFAYHQDLKLQDITFYKLQITIFTSNHFYMLQATS